MNSFHIFVFALALCHLLTYGAKVKVQSASELVELFQSGNPVTDDIVLTKDLDFSHTTLTEPLGSNDGVCHAYGGVLDGKGHSIKGVKMDTKKEYAGLFCSLKDATVQDLVLDLSCSFNGTKSAGALSVNLTGSVRMKNVVNKATVSGGVRAGGLIGSVESMKEKALISLDGCVNEGNVSSSDDSGLSFAGGLVGIIYGNKNQSVVVVSHCHNNGQAVESNNDAGGLFGGIQNNNDMVMTVSHSTNKAAVLGAYAGGLSGHIASNIDSSVVFFHCINTGETSQGYSGGFVAYADRNLNVSMTISQSKNEGSASGTYSGGFIGMMTLNSDMSTTILNSVNNGDVFGYNRHSTMNIGGFVGRIYRNTKITLALFNSTNNGHVTWAWSFVGGFIGYIEDNDESVVTISNSTNNGDATGNDYEIGGFVGRIKYASESHSLAFQVVNSANNGEVSSTRGVACGLFHVDPTSKGKIKTTVLNSISRGNVSAAKAYGIANNVTVARNVVSMGEVTGSSASYTFWNASTDADLFFGLDGKCINCSADATLFRRNTGTGFYEVVGSGQHVDDLLNEEALKQHYGMVWTSDLELVDPFAGSSSSSSSSSKSGSSHSVPHSSGVLLAVLLVGAFMKAL